MSQSEFFDVVVLGSGVAGLAAARRATAAGLSVCVVDKGRRIGGRVSTKRADGFTFNHGAQFLTARDPAFIEDCAAAIEASALADWHVAGRDAFCGAPTMRDFPAFLGEGIDVRQSFEVSSITRGADAGPAFCFTTADGTSVAGCRAVITAPAPQTAKLLSEIAPELAASAAAAEYAPCWTAMYGFDETQVPSHAQPYRGDSGPVGWAVWEAHRPTGTGGALTVQAAPRLERRASGRRRAKRGGGHAIRLSGDHRTGTGRATLHSGASVALRTGDPPGPGRRITGQPTGRHRHCR